MIYLFLNKIHFSKVMFEETVVDVDQVDSATVADIVFDQRGEERKPWFFCGNIALPRSEVVFFSQLIIVVSLITLCLVKLIFFNVSCEESSVWISLLSSLVGYILPNPRI